MNKPDCPEGKERNKNGRCVKIKTVKSVKDCPEGKVRNNNGRCVKIKIEAKKIQKNPQTKKHVKDCPEGKVRNENSRCVKIKNEKEKKTKKNKHKSSRTGTNSYKKQKRFTVSNNVSSQSDEDLNEEQRKEFDDILAKLKEGQLKGMNGNFDTKNELSITNCLKMFDIVSLEKELEKRRKEEEEKKKEEEAKNKPVINVLIPRKKINPNPNLNL